jgi:hypothetical protein
VRDLLRDFADVGYVWRHLPLADMHPNAELAESPRTSRAPTSAASRHPDLLINGRRHYGAYDIAALSDAVRAAGARASWRRPGRPSVARPPDSPSPSSAASEPPERRDDG